MSICRARLRSARSANPALRRVVFSANALPQSGPMPMAIAQFRFVDGPPARDLLLRELRIQLGEQAERRFDFIERKADRVELLSMDVVALLYGAKVCQAMGGTAFSSAGEGRVPIPPWAEVPWIEHGLLRRLRIRLGRITLAVVPDQDG